MRVEIEEGRVERYRMFEELRCVRQRLEFFRGFD
jgi:hypothetical protein